MKIRALVLSLAVVATVFTGCANKTATPTPTPSPSVTTPAPATTPAPNAVTSASITDNIDVFQKAISKDGTWIIAITKDLTTDKELVVDGVFKNKKTPPVEQRKIALYSQDAKHVVTARYTLTAPKLTFNSPSGSIEHGIFVGDVYVAGKNFKLIDQKITGNLYFLNTDAQKTFTKDATSTVSGKTELKK